MNRRGFLPAIAAGFTALGQGRIWQPAGASDPRAIARDPDWMAFLLSAQEGRLAVGGVVSAHSPQEIREEKPKKAEELWNERFGSPDDIRITRGHGIDSQSMAARLPYRARYLPGRYIPRIARRFAAHIEPFGPSPPGPGPAPMLGIQFEDVPEKGPNMGELHDFERQLCHEIVECAPGWTASSATWAVELAEGRLLIAAHRSRARKTKSSASLPSARRRRTASRQLGLASICSEKS